MAALFVGWQIALQFSKPCFFIARRRANAHIQGIMLRFSALSRLAIELTF